jgi:hypothetical protein
MDFGAMIATADTLTRKLWRLRMTIFDFMSQHPILTFMLAALCAQVGVAFALGRRS